MRRAVWLLSFLVIAPWVAYATHPVWAFPAFARQTKAACAACHVNPAGGASLTTAGEAFKADPKAAVPADTKSAEYVGINKCRMCHLNQFKTTQATKHAHAFAALEKGDSTAVAQMAAKLKVELKGSPTREEACVQCHVTGFHLPGGYPAADSVKTASLMNVTCEACHGPGSKHVSAPMADKKKMINRAVSAKLCTQCHTPETSPKFNFDGYRKSIVHVVKTSG